jgi:hypothetical protein
MLGSPDHPAVDTDVGYARVAVDNDVGYARVRGGRGLCVFIFGP